jgi:hypothetical protein
VLPALSVVIAVPEGAAGLVHCLRAVCEQADVDTEVIVASGMDSPAVLDALPDRVRWVRLGEGLLVPQLWAEGMKRARGRFVAITTSHFTPAADWVETIRRAHERLDSAGIGGRIDPPRGGSAVAWATYFLRYSDYLACDREQTATDIPGDNASYERAALQAHGDAIRDGFWEPEFHRLILAEGRKLTFVPAMRVRQSASYPFRAFCRQRLHHGRQFGLDRVRGKGGAWRLLRAASGPLIPWVFLAKIAGRVARSRRHLGPFLASSPVLLAFLMCWVTGEVWGYLTLGRLRAPEPLHDAGQGLER